MALTAAAGPITNLLLAFLAVVGYKLLYYVGPVNTLTNLLLYVLNALAVMNLALAALNLLPVPPLDGSRLLGLALPCSVEETCRYVQQPETLHRTEAQAAALARLQSLQALYAAWPDAEHIARKEDCTVNGTVLDYTVTYTVAADICG